MVECQLSIGDGLLGQSTLGLSLDPTQRLSWWEDGDVSAFSMRTIFQVILLVLISSANGATNPWDTHNPRREVTVDYLYESCSTVGETAHGDIPYFDCESYVYGVLDGYVKVRDQIPKSSRSCFPEKIEPWRVIEMADPKTSSYNRSQNAASFLIDFLVKRYPCS